MPCRRWSFVLAGLVALAAAVPASAQAPSAESPDKKITARADGKTISLIDAATQKELARMQGHAGNVTALAFSPDGRTLASADDMVVNQWDAATGKQLRSIRVAVAAVKLTFSQDGRTLTVEDKDKKKTVFDLATGQKIE
jgi:WD40 repeat protein